MAVTAPEAPNGTPGDPERRATAGTAPPDAAVPATRRNVVRGLLAPAALAVTLTPAAVAAVSAPTPSPPSRAGTTRPAHGTDGPAFDETYRGRRIQGFRDHRDPRGHETAPGDHAAVGADTWHVTVDGRPLHLLRRADGTWLTMVDHYRSYPTPLDAARAAVDELGPGRHLREPGHHHTGSGHGVHA
ncbi:hypothetical protein SUDANB145_04776 [Streptomyces sp. enrichment culture]|uniref:tyrosinase family oxidase copper chaperone n=1 Tax=Streptomyces sp. enrichment culture TaxID=1795815 RepID=UPI003F559A33